MTQETIKQSVDVAVQKNVNMNLRGLRHDLDSYVTKDLLWKEGDRLWKKNAQPAIDLGNNTRASTKTALFFLSIIATFAVIIGGIFTITRK